MTTRIHANNFSTTLNGAINNSVTSIVITSASGFPTVGAGVTANISVQNGSAVEIMTVTARSGTTLTVTRAAEGTSASSFADLSEVEIRATADSLDRKLDIANVASYVTDALITSTDITTNDVSITKHGFAPKAPNDATKYLDGTGAYTTPAGGGSGALTKLLKMTGSGGAALDFTSVLTTTYDNYVFIVSDIKGSTASFYMLVSFDNGATWKNTNSYNQAMMTLRSDSSTVSGVVAPNDAQMNIMANTNQNSTTSPIGGSVNMNGANGAIPTFEWKLAALGNGGGYHRYVTGSGNYYDGTSPPINAVRFMFATGNIASGTITLYGYTK